MSLTIGEMHVKTTVRYQLTPVRIATLNKSTNNKCWLDVVKGDTFTLVVMRIGAATVESRKLKMDLPFDP